MFQQKKRGQVTVFIIIGIILLFAAALLFYIRSRAVEEIPAAEVPTSIAEVPVELQPLHNYVLDCLRQTSMDALIAIGAHGGYIGTAPADAEEYDLPAFRFSSLGTNPTEDDGITISPDWQVPYWFSMKSPNACQANCEFTDRIPPLTGRERGSIEGQLNQYVRTHIVSCLNNFQQFRNEGYTIAPTADPAPTVSFGPKDVAVYLDYPLHIEKGGAASDIRQFLVRLDIPFRRIYSLAYDVARTEADIRFLEAHLLTLIAAYSGMDAERLPPMAGTSLDFTPVFWLRSMVQQNLQGILTTQTAMLRMANTRNYVFRTYGDDLLKTTLYRKKTIPFGKSYPDLDVEFSYLNWPMYLYITPGELIKPRESLTSKLPFIPPLPIQRYDLPYDVSYPALVQVHDAYAFNGKGYDFFIALEANVRNNAVLGNASSAISTSPSSGADAGQLCDPQQRNSGNYTFTVQDPSGKPVENAVVSFSSSLHICPISKTVSNSLGTIARFTGRFPTGAIGVMTVEKPGYTSYVKNFFAPKKENADLGAITLKPVITKRIVGRKVNVDYLTTNYDAGGLPRKEWVMRPSDQPLDANEKLVVIMERKKDGPFDQDFIAFTEVRDSDLTKNISLLPGDYAMTVMLFRENEEVIIPADRRCEGGVVGVGEECFTLPELHLESGNRQAAISAIQAEEVRAGQPLPPEVQSGLTAELPQPGIGVVAPAPEGTIMLEGQYALNVTIGDELYASNMPIRLTGISFNIAGVPQTERRHEHTQVLGELQGMVDANPALFTPRLGFVGAAGGAGGAVG